MASKATSKEMTDYQVFTTDKTALDFTLSSEEQKIYQELVKKADTKEPNEDFWQAVKMIRERLEIAWGSNKLGITPESYIRKVANEEKLGLKQSPFDVCHPLAIGIVKEGLEKFGKKEDAEEE